MAEIPVPSILETCIAAAVLYLLYYTYWELTVGTSRRKIIREHGCKPPPKLKDWDPILGLGASRTGLRWLRDHEFLKGQLTRFAEMGTNSYLMSSFGTPLLMTVEPENLKTIMSLNFKDFGITERRNKAFAPFLGLGIFTNNGTAWQHSRDMLRPNFHRSQVGDLETFETHVSHLIQAISRDGSTVDLQDIFFRLTIDSATEFLFGESTNCLMPGVSTVSAAKFADAFNGAQSKILVKAQFGAMASWLPDRQLKRCTKDVHDFADDMVEKGFARHNTLKQHPSNRYVFLDELISRTTNKLQIRSELLNVLLAGRDTTASLLSNVWHEISRRPAVFDRLRAEVLQLNGARPTFEQLKEMKYLRATLNESLRLHPVVPGNTRQAYADTVLPRGGGPDGRSPVFVRKGMLVGWSVYAMHRRRDLFGEDAEEFRPERWLGPDGLRPGWEYLPFNGGPRICLGQQFALTEASYTTVRLLQEFKAIESRDDRPWTEWITLTCTGLYGCKVGLTPA